MEQLGEELRRAREAAGLSLREMELRTKISIATLEALERNDFRRLPGGIYGRSFVRAYATEVGADPDETVARFLAMLEASEREAAERRAARLPEITQDDRQFLERQRRALLGLRAVVVLAVVGLVVLAVWRIRVMMLVEPEAPVEVAAPAPVIVPPEPADPVLEPQAQPSVPDAASTVMALEFELTGDCWISMSIDGAAPVARLYRAGEQQRIEASNEVLLDVGNAGALHLTIDGKRARSLGGQGSRVRTRITLDNRSTFLDAPAADVAASTPD